MSTIAQPCFSDLPARLHRLADQLDEYVCRYETKKDSRAIFTYAYVKITRTLADKIFQVEFQHPEWVGLLAEHFAAHYIQAMDSWDHIREEVPSAWKVVFETIALRRTSVIEDLVLAMTAHIVHDLPLSLTEVGLYTPAAESHIYDFHRMNDLLATDIQPIADGVAGRYEPFFRWIDHLERRHTLILTNFGFRVSRGVAWYNANRLMDDASRKAALGSITKSVQTLISDVRRPPVWSLRLLFRGLRWIAALFRVWPKPKKA
jgi:hypothetical protein